MTTAPHSPAPTYDAPEIGVIGFGDYANFVAQLAQDDEASRDEAESGLVLLERFAQVYRSQLEMARREARRLIRLRRSHVRVHSQGGYRQSPRKSSSQLSHA